MTMNTDSAYRSGTTSKDATNIPSAEYLRSLDAVAGVLAVLMLLAPLAVAAFGR